MRQKITQQLREHAISYRLLAYILTFSSLFTLLGTGFQLFWEYQANVGEIRDIFVQIEKSYLGSLTASQWMLDDVQTQAQLEGILSLPDVEHVRLLPAEGGLPLEVGQAVSERHLVHRYAMTHLYLGEEVDIGTLEVTVSLANVFAHLREQILVILGTQGLKTFATSLFILFIVQYVITRHLQTLGEHARQIRLDDLAKPLALQRPPRSTPDELDDVVTAMESMRGRLLTDVTALRFAEEAREQLIADLEAKNTEMDHFNAAVSHDLKGPLITIQGFLTLLRKDIEADEKERVLNDLQRIEDASRKMYQLVENLLALSRAGRLVGQLEEAPLSRLAENAVALLDGRIAERGVDVEVADDLPVVYGDPTRLQTVFQNLVENAVKYIGDVEQPRIEIGSRCDGDEIVCYVRDNGIGLDKEEQEKIFEWYGQSDPKAEGAGIGLALVERIVNVHRGRIWVESEGCGQGTTFCFFLPEDPDFTQSAAVPVLRRAC